MSIVPEDPTIDPTGNHDDNEPKLTMPEESGFSIDASSEQQKLVQQKNYHIASPLIREQTEDEKLKYEDVSIHFLPDTPERINSLLQDDGKMGEMDVVDKTLSWYRGILQGFKAHPTRGVFSDALSDPNASWQNALKHGSTTINIGKPSFNNRGRGDAAMSSERLVLSARSKLGLGAPLQTPMMGSGFYVMHKPLDDADIIALWREILIETVKLGRVTHGLVFSNNQGLAFRALTNKWVDSIVETTVSDLDKENIYDHLTINDLPAISISVAGSVYPNGFPMTRSVFTENTNRAKEEIHQMIDVRKTLFMNDKKFTDGQREHMAKRIGRPMTLKAVKEYRAQFNTNDPIVDLGSGIKLHLHTPSLREYFDSCEKWVNEITITVQNALGDSPKENERLSYISQLALATRLRQYSHYVKAIEEDGELFTTRENVDRTLSGLSSSPGVAEAMYKAVSEYINSTQVAIAATTSVSEYEDTFSGEKWPRLIPIDTLSVFFQLVEQKLRGIASRSLEDTSD